MYIDLPDDEPVNIMAPTPHHPRKKKLPAKVDLKSKVGDYFLAYYCSLTSVLS